MVVENRRKGGCDEDMFEDEEFVQEFGDRNGLGRGTGLAAHGSGGGGGGDARRVKSKTQ